MEKQSKEKITVGTTIAAPIEEVWRYWTETDHIRQWNHASNDWHTPRAENDLRAGGRFVYRMEAKDGSSGFDFGGTYDQVKLHQLISYTLGDGRKVKILFEGIGNATWVFETFDAEATHSMEAQKNGWQAIMNNFKNYTELLHSHKTVEGKI